MRAARNGVLDTTAALDAFLQAATTTEWVMVDLYRVELVNLGAGLFPVTDSARGLVLLWADYPYAVPFEGLTYLGGLPIAGQPASFVTDSHGRIAGGPRITRGDRKEGIGVDVATLELTIHLDGTEELPPADGLDATPRIGLAEAIAMGLFEGAYVSVRRLHMPDHPVWPLTPDSFDLHLGAVDLFTGQVIDSKVSQTVATLAVHSHTERHSLGLPRNLVQPQCPNTLYDPMCGASRTGVQPVFLIPFQAVGTIAAVTDLANIVVDITGAFGPPPDTWFTLGTAQLTAGVLAGYASTIRAHLDTYPTATLQLLGRLPRSPAVGDAIVLQAGCKKDVPDCFQKFGRFQSAVQGFRGFVDVPAPDSAI